MSTGQTAAPADDRVEALSRRLAALEDTVGQLVEENDELRQRLEEQDERHREELAELEQRTDLLSLVEEPDKLKPKQKSAILIQNLHRKAKKKQSRGKKPHASFTREQAENTLQNVDQERSTFYTDMERAADMVGDDNGVLDYSGGELKLNLEKGDLPRSKHGLSLHSDANGGR